MYMPFGSIELEYSPFIFVYLLFIDLFLILNGINLVVIHESMRIPKALGNWQVEVIDVANDKVC